MLYHNRLISIAEEAVQHSHFYSISREGNLLDHIWSAWICPEIIRATEVCMVYKATVFSKLPIILNEHPDSSTMTNWPDYEHSNWPNSPMSTLNWPDSSMSTVALLIYIQFTNCINHRFVKWSCKLLWQQQASAVHHGKGNITCCTLSTLTTYQSIWGLECRNQSFTGHHYQ